MFFHWDDSLLFPVTTQTWAQTELQDRRLLHAAGHVMSRDVTWCHVSSASVDEASSRRRTVVSCPCHRSLSTYGNMSAPSMHWASHDGSSQLIDRPHSRTINESAAVIAAAKRPIRSLHALNCSCHGLLSSSVSIDNQYEECRDEQAAAGCIKMNVCFISWPLHWCILGI